MKRDLRAVGSWYNAVQAHEARRLEAEKNVVCTECGRCFRRESVKACHKCIAERRKPVSEQANAVHSVRVVRGGPGAEEIWQCIGVEGQESPNNRGETAAAPQEHVVVCRECGRTFNRQGDLKRYKRLVERSRPVQKL